MNPYLSSLQPYPFEKLRTLFSRVEPAAKPGIRLSIGEPQHETPRFIMDALSQSLGGLAVYPTTAGQDVLRQTLVDWIKRRYQLPALELGNVLPVNGSREALFSFAQCVIDSTKPGALVASPNPFYQIYEGAAYLAGAQPVFLNQTSENGFGLDLDALSAAEWSRVQLLYVCSPGNPTGRVLSLDEWKQLFALADQHGFVIAADECYSEIYFDEAHPPIGALQAAQRLGRSDFERIVVFSSLSKRSSVPGLRSGFVAGDAKILKQFLLYRTYHGCAMSLPVQTASIAAWNDEAHVVENRRLYREKFAAVQPILSKVLDAPMPDAGFYLWVRTPGDDTQFARDLLQHTNVTVLPGQYLAREARGVNPGQNRIRLALVAGLEECVEAAERIAAFCR